MFYWLLQRVLYRGFRSRRGIVGMNNLDAMAGADTGAWAIAQEKARLDYLAAKEEYERLRSWRSFQRVMERLLQLHSTNAIVQALINERLLGLMAVSNSSEHCPANPEAPAVRMSA
jgi:hypothetical protein